MKFTLSWLKEHLDTQNSVSEIAERLTAIGLEVESISDNSATLAPFTVAKILSAEKHPEADKLRVCKVQSDIGELQIVCGAPNARAGIFVALAKEGAVIPANGMVIKKTKIRNVESSGMLCSADELSIEGDADGIIELPESKIGESIVKILGLDDSVIDVAVTPNRPDALGVRGIARDLAAAGLGKLKPLPEAGFKGNGKSPISVSIAGTFCHQFIGCYIKNVKNGASPDWMKKRLAAIGQKSISALVDITNYITIDLGRPLHVYDAKKLKGNIVVRDAKASEKLLALNDKEYTLPSGAVVIADDSGPVALGGIIGGAPTGCDATTTDVFLEIALFHPASVAKTGRALAIDSDARYRFERGVDPAFVEPGAKHAIHLIQQLCGGVASELVVAGKTPAWEKSIVLDIARIESLGGVRVSKDRALQILQALGFACSVNGDMLKVVPPSWRSDIDGEADLIEEILRIEGYDNIPATPLPKLAAIGKSPLSLAQSRTQIAKRMLASRGFLEACTFSFLPHKQAVMFGGGGAALQLANPISEELSDMRPSLLPNLLEAAKKNAFRGFKNINLSEVGLQFSSVAPDGQRMVASGIRAGNPVYYMHDEKFQTIEPAYDAYDAKTDALALLQTLGMNKADITTNTPGWYHPGRSGALTLGGKIILGYFGEIHPAILAHYDIKGTAVGFEIFLDAIPTPRSKSKARAVLKLSDFQAVERDFAFVVDRKISVAQIIKTLSGADKTLITDITIFDVYVGTGLPEGKKSVAVKVTLQATDRTLSEQDIAAVSKAIVDAAAKGFGGQLRQ
jgi:phenylalanyl-tRNA synthetase beta chain